jgi:hypothetical protein
MTKVAKNAREAELRTGAFPSGACERGEREEASMAIPSEEIETGCDCARNRKFGRRVGRESVYRIDGRIAKHKDEVQSENHVSLEGETNRQWVARPCARAPTVRLVAAGSRSDKKLRHVDSNGPKTVPLATRAPETVLM